MKTFLLSSSLAALVIVSLPVAAFSQAAGASGTVTPGGGTTGSVGAGTNMPGIPSAGMAMPADPMVLFRQLDTDHDGKLSQEEFSRITAAMSSAATGSGTARPAAGTGVSGTTGGSTTNSSGGAAR